MQRGNLPYTLYPSPPLCFEIRELEYRVDKIVERCRHAVLLSFSRDEAAQGIDLEMSASRQVVAQAACSGDPESHDR